MLDQNPQAKSAIGKIRGGCSRINVASDLTFREFSWRRVGKVIEILRADEIADFSTHLEEIDDIFLNPALDVILWPGRKAVFS